MPGDVIACGTSLGAGTMGDAHNVVDIVIDGVGSLSNVFDQVLPSPYLLGAPPQPGEDLRRSARARSAACWRRKFALAGEDVTVIDQGAHLAAIQKNGLKLEWHDGKVQTAKVKAVDKAADAGKQDIVVLAVKAHFLDQVVRDIDCAARSRHHRADRAERTAVVVFPEARRQVRQPPAGEPRSLRRAHQEYRSQPRHRLRRLSGGARSRRA